MRILPRFASQKPSTFTAASIEQLYKQSEWQNGKTEKEYDWQSRARFFADEIGFVSNSLNTKATLGALGTLEPSDLNGIPIDNPFLKGTIRMIKWATSLEDNVYSRMYQRPLVGEYWNCQTTRGWTTATTPQLYPARKANDYNHRYLYVFLRPNANPSKEFLADARYAVPLLNQPTRHIKPGATYSNEATSDVKANLRELELYLLLIQGIINDRESLTQWAKIVYLGEDDGKWIQHPDLAARGVPPQVAEFLLLGKDRKVDDPAQAYPYMGTKPEVIELAAKIDPELIPLLDYLMTSYARGVNLPVRVITGETGNDWSDYEMYRQLVRTGISPDLTAICNEITEDIWRPGLKKLIEINPLLGEEMGISPDLVKLTPNLELISSTRSNPTEVIALLTARVINYDQARKMLDIPDEGKFVFPAELSENEAIEQLINKATESRTGISAPREPTQAAAHLELEGHVGAIEKNTYKEVKGYRLDDKLNRLELKLWGQLQGILDTETNAMLSRVGRSIIRGLSDAKTASAKTTLESLRDTTANDIVFEVDHAILAANGVDMGETVKQERHTLEQAILAALAAAHVTRNNILRAELPDRSAQAAGVASYAVMRHVLNHKKLGEDEVTTYAPATIAPDILAAAGGAEVQDSQVLRSNDGTVLRDGRSHIAGYAIGVDVQTVLKRQQREITWSWYHDHPRQAFPPHVALNGVQFTESTRVSATGGMYPGDHRGCLCSYQIVIGE